MTLKQAIKIIENYNKWRRSHRDDRNEPKLGDVKDIGIAIDVLLIIAKDYSKIHNMDKVDIKLKNQEK